MKKRGVLTEIEEALRAERVRVLEEVEEAMDADPDCPAFAGRVVRRMLSEARSASGKEEPCK